MRFLRIASLLALIAARPGLAQHQHDLSHGAHAHERLGTVNFPISCGAQAQAKFNRGVALLHSFWYDEAEKTFREIAAAHPKCGMAWWGVAMSQYHPIWAAPNPTELQRGREAAKKAKSIGARTERERAYIDAIGVFYRDSDRVEHPIRARAFQSAMEKLTARYPDDDEAAIFHALTLISRGMAESSDKTYTHQKKAAEILNRILPDQPEHPGIAHYVIHSFDYPALANLALPAARAYSKIAPDSAHALHMPSHIFVRLGMWAETIDSNIVSANAGHNNVMKQYPGATSWDQLHAYDYMAYAHLQRGEDDKVKQLVDELPTITKLDIDSFGGYYALAAIPVRYALERRKWSEAAALEVQPKSLAWNRYPYAEALIYFGRALGAARSGDVARARADIERLQQLRQTLVDQKNNYWAEQVEIQRRAAEAWIARAEGRNDDAVAMMRSAADMEDATEKHPVTPGAVIPAREMLAELLLELNQPEKALPEFERALKDSPNRLNGLSGAARAAQLAGDREKARAYYIQVAKLLGSAEAVVRTAAN